MDIYNKLPFDIQIIVNKFINLDFINIPYNKLIKEFKKKRKIFSWVSSPINNSVGIFFYFDNYIYKTRVDRLSPKSSVYEYYSKKNDFFFYESLSNKKIDYANVFKYKKSIRFKSFFE